MGKYLPSGRALEVAIIAVRIGLRVITASDSSFRRLAVIHQLNDSRLASHKRTVRTPHLQPTPRLRCPAPASARKPLWVANSYSCGNLALPGFCPVELCTVVLSADKVATGTLHEV